MECALVGTKHKPIANLNELLVDPAQPYTNTVQSCWENIIFHVKVTTLMITKICLTISQALSVSYHGFTKLNSVLNEGTLISYYTWYGLRHLTQQLGSIVSDPVVPQL